MWLLILVFLTLSLPLFRDPKIGSIALAELLESKGTTLKLEQAEKQLNVAFTAAQGFNVLAVIGRREAKDTKTGQLFLRWHLTGEHSL
jgi:hypothetical protein